MVAFVSLSILSLGLLVLIGLAMNLIVRHRNEPNVTVPITVILVVLFLCLLTSTKATVDAARKLDEHNQKKQE